MSGGVLPVGRFSCHWWGPRSHVSCFSCCSENTRQEQLQGKGFLLAHGLRSSQSKLCLAFMTRILGGLGLWDTCSSAGGSVWGGLGSGALHPEVHHWGRALRFSRGSPLPGSPTVLAVCGLGCEHSGCCSPLQSACCELSRHSNGGVFSVLNCKPQINLSFHEQPWQRCFITATEK